MVFVIQCAVVHTKLLTNFMSWLNVLVAHCEANVRKYLLKTQGLPTLTVLWVMIVEPRNRYNCLWNCTDWNNNEDMEGCLHHPSNLRVTGWHLRPHGRQQFYSFPFHLLIFSVIPQCIWKIKNASDITGDPTHSHFNKINLKHNKVFPNTGN